MTQLQVIERFCKLGCKVNEYVFNWQEASDCFCIESDSRYFQYDPKIIEFIENAVNEKIEREKKL